MADLFVLATLSRSTIILDREYRVAWDCEAHKATVIYTQVGADKWESVSQIFDSELKAHEYISNLKTLHQKPDSNWRSI